MSISRRITTISKTFCTKRESNAINKGLSAIKKLQKNKRKISAKLVATNLVVLEKLQLVLRNRARTIFGSLSKRSSNGRKRH